MTADDFAKQLQEDYRAAKLARANQPRPQRGNHCHSAGHPCDRYLVLVRVAWRLKAPEEDPLRASLFEEGHHQERALKEDLGLIRYAASRGYEIVQQKKPIGIPVWDVHGEVDFCLRALGEELYYVADAKSCSPGTFKSIERAEDLWQHRRWWVRQWPVQLLLYLLGVRVEADRLAVERWYHDDAAMLLLKDKLTGDLRAIPVPWDGPRVEAILDRLSTINEIVKRIKNTLGEAADPAWGNQLEELRAYLPAVLAAPDVCPGCSFFAFCCPELSLPVGHAEILDDPDLEAWLESRQLLKQAHELYDEADAEAKASLNRYKVTLGPDGKAYWLVGSFLITVRKVSPRNRPSYFAYDIWRRPDPPKEELK
jgi:hypothetical protein